MSIPDNLLSDMNIYKKHIQTYLTNCFSHFPDPISYQTLIKEFVKAKPPKKNGNQWYNKRNKITKGLVKFTITNDYKVSMNMIDKKVLENDARYNVVLRYFKNTLKYCKKQKLPVPNTYCVVFFADRHPFELEFSKIFYPMFSFSCPKNKNYPVIPDNTFMEFSFEKRFGQGESWDKSKKIFKDNIYKAFKDKHIFFRGKDTTKYRTNLRRILYDIQDQKMMKIELLDENNMKYIPMYEFSKYKYLLDLPGKYEWSNRFPRLFLCNRLVIKINNNIIQYPNEKEFMAFSDLLMRPNIDYLNYDTSLNETKYVNYDVRSKKNTEILKELQKKILKDIKKLDKDKYNTIRDSGFERINQLKNKHLYLYLYYGILANHKYLSKLDIKGGKLELSKFNSLLNNSFAPGKVNKMYDYYRKNRVLNERIFYKSTKIFPKTKIAIVVPFRDNVKQERAGMFKRFILHFKKFLKNFTYQIFIIEQSDDEQKFNGGKLLNIGIQKAIVAGCDVIISHDIDIYPNKDTLPLYSCVPKYPNHIGNIWKTKYTFWEFVGGIFAMTPEQSIKTNGYPNNFWGWGGEDDAVYNRIAKTYGKILKPENGTIEEWEHNKSSPGSTNLKKKECIMTDLLKWKENGLNNLKYYTVNVVDYGTREVKPNISKKAQKKLEKIYKSDYEFIENLKNKKSGLVQEQSSNRTEGNKTPSNKTPSNKTPSNKTPSYYTLKSDKYKIIFFWNAKAGCSTLKRFIYEIEEDEKLSKDINIHAKIGQLNNNKYYVEMNPKNIKKYKKYKKILLFRDPVKRVYSFYKDKVLQQKRESFIKHNKSDQLGPLTTFDDLVNKMEKIPINKYQHHLESQTNSIKKEWIDEILSLKDLNKFLKDLANYKTIQDNITEGKTNITKYTVDIHFEKYKKNKKHK
jgi:hypothetical protein